MSWTTRTNRKALRSAVFGTCHSAEASVSVTSRNPVLNAALGNWTLDWIFSYYSGYPVSWPDLVLNTSVPGCGSWYVANQSSQQWFNNNKFCYSTCAPYTLRTNPDRFSESTESRGATGQHGAREVISVQGALQVHRAGRSFQSRQHCDLCAALYGF